MQPRLLIILLLAGLLTACHRAADSALPATAMLTVRVCESSDIRPDAYPLRIFARSDRGTTLDEQTISHHGASAAFSLPSFMRYQILVRDSHRHFASVFFSLGDQPATLLLSLSERDTTTISGDTTHISFDDPIGIDSTLINPMPGTRYGPHVIAFVDYFAADSALLTLLSLAEWSDLTSADHTDHPFDPTLVSGYCENDLMDWHIPTADQAKRLRTVYGSDTQSYTLLQHLLDSVGADPLTLRLGSDNARYLCDEGHKTFSFVSGTTTAKAGTKASNYRLRLVRTLRVSAQYNP